MNGAGKGFIISIEGLDQSGKRTQTRRLVARLKKNGFPVEHLSFLDYSTVIGREIEAFLAGERTYNPETRHMLLSLNRWERKDDLDRWLSEGKVVVLNRYSGSNYAYGAANGLALDWLMNLEKGLPQPDLTILLDVPPRVSLKRKASGGSVSSHRVSKRVVFYPLRELGSIIYGIEIVVGILVINLQCSA